MLGEDRQSHDGPEPFEEGLRPGHVHRTPSPDEPLEPLEALLPRSRPHAISPRVGREGTAWARRSDVGLEFSVATSIDASVVRRSDRCLEAGERCSVRRGQGGQSLRHGAAGVIVLIEVPAKL